MQQIGIHNCWNLFDESRFGEEDLQLSLCSNVPKDSI